MRTVALAGGRPGVAAVSWNRKVTSVSPASKQVEEVTVRTGDLRTRRVGFVSQSSVAEPPR